MASCSLYLADPATGAGASGVNEVEVHGNGTWVLESVVKRSVYVVTARLQDGAGLPPGTYSLDARHWVLRTHGRVEGIVAGATGVEIAVDQPE